MSDPLGFISRAGSVGYTPPGGEPRQATSGHAGPDFKTTLMQNIEKVNQMQQEASAAIEDLQTGKRNDVEGVLLATQKADAAFRTLLATRNKVQQAYEELKQLRV